MRFIFLLFLFFLNLNLFCQWIPSKFVLQKRDKALEKFYDFEVSIKESNFDKNTYFIISNKKKIGYLCLRQSPSKHDVFDYMVILDNNMQIEYMKILAYREDYGGEISAKRWLKQFTNRKAEEVQAISGATISVNSLKRDIINLKEQMSQWVQN